jgi:hypothetical protein
MKIRPNVSSQKNIKTPPLAFTAREGSLLPS